MKNLKIKNKVINNFLQCRSQMVLQDEQTGFWCHTLLKDVPEKIRLQNKGKNRLLSILF